MVAVASLVIAQITKEATATFIIYLQIYEQPKYNCTN